MGVHHAPPEGGSVGGVMFNTRGWIALGLLSVFAVPAMAQSFRVQCPTSTVTHPNPASNNSEPTAVGAGEHCERSARHASSQRLQYSVRPDDDERPTAAGRPGGHRGPRDDSV